MRDILSDIDGAAQNDPIKTSQKAMRKPLPKRFYQLVAVTQVGDLFAVALDGRIVKTPGKKPIEFAQRAFAERLAEEFDAQKTEINPALMPFYRLVNTALDGVATDMQAVREDIIRFSSSDLLCYRAEGPEELAALQADHWDGPLDWIAGLIGCPFSLAQGIIHVSQPKAAIAGFSVLVRHYDDPLAVSALHLMTSLTGSAILALAVMKGELTPHEAWCAAHVDEDWNIAQWGEDLEAKALRASKWRDMEVAGFVAAQFNDHD